MNGNINDTMQSGMMTTPEALRQDYVCYRKLGENATGQTYLAMKHGSQQRVVIKILKMAESFEAIEAFKNEAKALANIHVQGVPKFLGFVASPTRLDECYIIQEYCTYPNLQQIMDMHRSNGTSIHEQTVLSIMMRVADILVGLHMNYSPPILHRDIKPSNILYDEYSGQVMLIDFGSVAAPKPKVSDASIGSYGFTAPEVFADASCVQSDFYALGMTALSLLSGMTPEQMELFYSNQEWHCDKLLKNSKVSQETIDLIQNLVSSKIENRPNNAMELKKRLAKVMEKHATIKLAKSQSMSQKAISILTKLKKVMSGIHIGLICLLAILAAAVLGFSIYLTKFFDAGVLMASMMNIDMHVIMVLGFVLAFVTWLFFVGYIQRLGRKILPLLKRMRDEAKNLPDTGCKNHVLISAYAPVDRTSLPDCAESVYYHDGQYYYYYGNVPENSSIEVKPGVMRQAKNWKS